MRKRTETLQVITVRLGESQKEVLIRAAKERGLSLNQFCVEALSGADESMEKVLGELRPHGVLPPGPTSLTAEEAIEEVCTLTALVYKSIADFRLPSDGFCHRCPFSQELESYKNAGGTIEYLRRAVVNQLRREGYQLAVGWDKNGRIKNHANRQEKSAPQEARNEADGSDEAAGASLEGADSGRSDPEPPGEIPGGQGTVQAARH